MKKLLVLVSILFMGLAVVACQDTTAATTADANATTLASAKTSLNAVFSDPSNITNNITVPTSLASGAVTATWTSSEPGVIAFSEPADGVATGVVNRPALGDGDATVTVTATLTIADLSDTWSQELTVKENTVAEISINTVADIFAITDSSYDGTYQVTIEDLTVIAAGDDAVFAYDGTGIIEIYGGASSSMEVGKVYTVAGTIDWYYGLWEITSSTATEQTTAVADIPTPEAITSVDTYITALLADGADDPAKGTVADGSFEPVYATVTGKVYVIPGDTSNYNTYVIDTTATELTVGSSEAAATGFMVYYHTNDLATVRLYDGIEVTMNVVIYTYRSNNNAFAIYYVGGPDGITANLSDEQKQSIDAGSLSIPESTTEAITLDLPTTGANGSTIVWSYTDSENTDNSYVDLTTGAVTVPSEVQVSVGLTATVSYGTLADVVVEFTIKIGEYPVSTIADAIAAGTGVTVKVVGIITDTTDAAGYGAYWLQDATGGFDLFNKYSVFTDEMIGHTYEIIGTVDVYNGLYELVVASIEDVTEVTTDPLTMPTAIDLTSSAVDAETLLPYQGQLVDLSGYVLKSAVATDPTSSFTMYFINSAGNEISVRLDKDVTGFADFVAIVNSAAAGTAFDFTNAILGWYNGPQLLVGSGTTIAAGTAYTEQQQLDTAVSALSVPEASVELINDLTLPTEGLFGATVAWTSSNDTVISTTGVVTRPAVGESDATVTLSYVVTVGSTSTTAVTIEFTVLAEVAGADVLAYTTGFESSEGFTASTVYNNTTEAFTGPTGNQWGTFYGTPSTTSYIYDGQSMQMRYYTTAPSDYGYTYTNFTVANVSKVVFTAKDNANVAGVEVFYSVDNGVTWVSVGITALTTTATEYTVNINATGDTMIKFQLAGTTVAERLTIDNVNIYSAPSN